MYQQIRAMKGRGEKVPAAALAVGQVFRLEGTKWRVQRAPVRQSVTGSVRVEAYNEDNQHESLFLNPRLRVPVLGVLR